MQQKYFPSLLDKPDVLPEDKISRIKPKLLTSHQAYDNPNMLKT